MHRSGHRTFLLLGVRRVGGNQRVVVTSCCVKCGALTKVFRVLGSASGHLVPGLVDSNGGVCLVQEFQAFNFKSLEAKSRVLTQECQGFFVSCSADLAGEVAVVITQEFGSGNDVISSVIKPFFRTFTISGKVDKGRKHRDHSLGKCGAVFGCEEDSLPGRFVALGHVSEDLVEESFRFLGAAHHVANHVAFLVQDAWAIAFINRGNQWVGDVQEEVLEINLDSFDGCHCMQVLDDGCVNGGSHASGKDAVSAIHVAVENEAGRC